MRSDHRIACCFLTHGLAPLGLLLTLALPCLAQSRGDIVVPGTGVQLNQVGDDFEEESWDFIPNNPKSTEYIDIHSLALDKETYDSLN